MHARPDSILDNHWNLIQKCWSWDPVDRPGAAEVTQSSATNTIRPGATEVTRPFAMNNTRLGAAEVPRPSAMNNVRPGAVEVTRSSGIKTIIIFGESNVGKSSIINLLARRKVARTSLDTRHCTLRYEAYDVIIGNVPYRIYDTAGIDDDRMDPVGFLDAVTNAHKLMKELKTKGGPHLLLYCMKAGRIQPSFAAIYRLFYEFLFEEKIPVALVVTHLEREDPMDEWYTRNKGSFERHAVKCIDHACITAAENMDPRYKKKYNTSREAVGDLIRRHVHEVENWDGGEGWLSRDGGEGWLSRFIGKSKDLSTGRPSKSDVFGVLTKRCGMEESLAKDVIRRLNR
ncbi:P-loop containing nucleoside triphosphate hydrolase protein [Suillus paluster]|uniref:P-loop containing nucleoside triphosphate hydrolase protein n=1 Tax=Suillus paluster TaxID=48578 RepID=UPI001B86CADE|nr:P-loop containing nucleoside triphosphate hydrolase protein [Suillus paluster]KAG1745546.1 P-loop containing nucleoside triphosphate hydrolase protein [Suillus paluster]